MSVGIGSTIKKTSTPFIGSTGTAKTAAPATADAAAAQAVPPGVQNAGTTFKKLAPNPFSMWAKPLTPGQAPPKTPLPISSLTPQSPALQAKLDSGTLEASDFEGLSPGNVADSVAALARGGIDQKQNLAKLMADPAFAKQHLTNVLNNDKLPLAGRAEVLKAVGESKDPAAFETLQAALDGMVPTRRNDLLREGLAGGDTAVLKPINQYLTAKPAAAAQFLKSTTSQDIDDKKLTSILKGVDSKSLDGALKALGSGSAEDAQNVFKRLGAAVYTSKQDGGIRKQLETALDDMPTASRASLLQKVIVDRSGNQGTTDQQVNFGQHLVAQYLERKGPEGVKQFLDSIAPANPMANAPKLNPNDPKSFQAHNDYALKVAQNPANQMRHQFETFIQNNLSEKVQRAADRPGSVNPGYVAKADVALADLNKAPDFRHGGNFPGSGWQAPHDNYVEAVKGLSPAELEAHFGKLSTQEASKLVNVLSPDRIGYDYADKTRLELVNDVASRGGPVARAKIAAGMAKTFEKAPPNDSNKELVRAQVAQLLQKDPNGAIREMSSDDLQNVAKVFMAHPANMEKLNELLLDLGPQAAAKLMRAVAVIAPEVTAEAKNGTWVGDLFKGLSISGKAGKGGHEGAPSAEISFGWSPAAMVDGDRQRSADQVNSQFNRFMDGWMQQLNEMSLNDKAIFAAKLPNKVTPEVR